MRILSRRLPISLIVPAYNAETFIRAALASAGIEKPDPQDYLERLIGYAQATNWGKRPTTREGSFEFARRAP